MARMREALRQADGKRSPASEAIRPHRPDSEPEPEPVTEEEIPFIEVGGPRSQLEASASVLASPRRPLPQQNQAPATTANLCLRPLVASAPGETGLAGATFRSLPLEVPPLPPVQQRLAADLVVFHQPEHPLSEQYRSVLTALEAVLPAKAGQVLLFAGTRPCAGTSLLLSNLAIARAQQAPVVMVDANLHHPGLSGQLGLPLAPGLSDVLTGCISLQRAIQETGVANLQILTAGKAAEGIQLLLAGEAMRGVLRHLRERFDRVFVDAACWDGRPGVVALGSASDAVYLVVPEEQASSAELAELLQLIPQQGSQLRGCILVKAA